MNCKYSGSGCEMTGTLEDFGKTTIDYSFDIIRSGLCETENHKSCKVYKLKESLAGEKQ